MAEVAAGSLEEDWDILPPKKIKVRCNGISGCFIASPPEREQAIIFTRTCAAQLDLFSWIDWSITGRHAGWT